MSHSPSSSLDFAKRGLPNGCRGHFALLLVVLGTASSFARQGADEEELFPDDAVEVQAAELGQPQFGPEQFDQWVFGDSRGGRNPDDELDRQLDLRCERIDKEVRLTEEQRRKLRLAGQGDLFRFRRRVASARAKFETVRKDPQQIGNIWQDIQPVRQQFQLGLFGQKSLFQKTLNGILDPEQLDAYRRREFSRLQFGYAARIDRAIVQWEGLMPLTQEQRQALRSALLETPPPSLFGNMDTYYVQWQLARIPEAKLKPILDVGQWEFMKHQRTQAAGFKDMLAQNGVEPVILEKPSP